ncbi:zinc finger protein 184-like isoform X2 [Pieris brassicae]|uniref:zinc finger protein 184-like isoform X2 n=1 Tax=Pieris brassicae TaxID=7116 RepID=UPI001E66003B|nr:zinc finger protein 184-like isoform X2 [Pieris brassicae]
MDKEDQPCNICLQRLGSQLDLKWIKFLENFGIQENNIFLCEWCNHTLLKMERFILLLLHPKDRGRYKDQELNIQKLDSINIPPTIREIYIKEETYESDVNNIGIDDLNYSEENVSENISETNAYNMNFEVTYLSLDDQKNEILFKKKSVKFKNMLFKCEKCGIGFVSHEAYKDHNLRHDNDTAIHICPICHLHFKSHLVLSQHKLSHKRRFKCVLCGMTFKRWAHAVGHRFHCGSEPSLTKCDQCQKIFDNQYALDIHKKIHSRKEKYICDECAKCFGTKQHLIIHLRMHTGVKPFKCTKCDKSFSTNSNLKTHKVVHSDEKMFYCVECNKSFKSEKSLKRHFATTSKHVEEKMYSCADCMKLFTSAVSLSSHRRSRHLSTNKCFICDKIFSNKSNLKKHLKIHSQR